MGQNVGRRNSNQTPIGQIFNSCPDNVFSNLKFCRHFLRLHSGTSKWRGWDSNPRPGAYEATELPTAPPRSRIAYRARTGTPDCVLVHTSVCGAQSVRAYYVTSQLLHTTTSSTRNPLISSPILVLTRSPVL